VQDEELFSLTEDVLCTILHTIRNDSHIKFMLSGSSIAQLCLLMNKNSTVSRSKMQVFIRNWIQSFSAARHFILYSFIGLLDTFLLPK